MKPVKSISFLIIVVLTVVACENKKEIEADLLARIFVDLSVVEDFYADSDSLNIKRSEVFKKYSVTESQYDSAYKTLSYNKEEWEKFFKSGDYYLDSLKNELKQTTSK